MQKERKKEFKGGNKKAGQKNKTAETVVRNTEHHAKTHREIKNRRFRVF